MILHFSHIGLTDGLTFMIPFGWRASMPHGRVGTVARTVSMRLQPEADRPERNGEC
jgi:hypothetical protein